MCNKKWSPLSRNSLYINVMCTILIKYNSNCILLTFFIVFATDAPTPGVSLTAKTVKDVTSSSAPAYWSAQCGGSTFAGSYTVMMPWADCRGYCRYFPHAAELGHTFQFADILDSDTMECLRFNMMQQYSPGNGYTGH